MSSPTPLKINAKGVGLIKQFEGCKLIPYKDVGGLWTVGWGHLLEGPNMPISQETADDLLTHDLDYIVQRLNSILTIQLNDNQFSALCCLGFNIGPGKLQNSILIKYINLGQFDMAAKEFVHWDHVNGKVIPGLLNRRIAEQSLFTKE